MTGGGKVVVTAADIARALNHLGFDSVEDLHYWAADDNELNRFDALCQQLAEHRQSALSDAVDVVREAERALRKVDRMNDHPGWFRRELDEAVMPTLARLTDFLALSGRG